MRLTQAAGRAIAGGACGLLVAGLAAPANAEPRRSAAAIALQTAIERVCLPMLSGAPAGRVAKANGLERRDGRWRSSRGAQVALAAPDKANPHVCSFRITYPVDDGPGLLQLMQAWSASRGLAPGKVKAASRGPSRARETSTWSGRAPQGRLALVFARERTLDGKPLADGKDEALVLISLTPSPAPAA